MAERIYNRFLVIKNKDAEKYLTKEEKEYLTNMLVAITNGRARDGKKRENTYLVCNTNESYSDKVLEVILQGETDKEVSNE
jgi:hypothetical protein